MSVRSKLDDILKHLSENAHKMDESTKNIASATTRVTYELAKSQSICEKYNVPLEKYEQIIDFTQNVVDICSNYITPSELENKKRNAGAEAIQYEQFEAKAINQLDKNEKEIVKLQSLRDIINQVSANNEHSSE